MAGKIKSFIISVVLISIGLLLMAPIVKSYAPAALHPYLSEIGQALLVGMVVSLAVDRFLKADLLAEIGRDVLRFTVGYELPEQIRNEIRHLLRLPIVRRNFTMKFKIAPSPLDPGIVEAEMATTFQVDNLSMRKREYNFTSSIQRSPLPEVGQSSIACMEMSGPGAFRLSGEELARVVTTDEHFQRFSRRVELPPKDSIARTFSTVRKTIFPSRDVYVLDVLEPTINIKIEIALPDGFRSSVYFPVQGETTRTVEGNVISYLHEGVFLPGQFVRISWGPQDAPSSK